MKNKIKDPEVLEIDFDFDFDFSREPIQPYLDEAEEERTTEFVKDQRTIEEINDQLLEILSKEELLNIAHYQDFLLSRFSHICREVDQIKKLDIEGFRKPENIKKDLSKEALNAILIMKEIDAFLSARYGENYKHERMYQN